MNSKSIFTAAAVLLVSNCVMAQQEGKQLFQTRCTACHSVNTQVVGPALAGIDKRRDLNWITHFVHSSQTVIKEGDPYADALFIKFNKTVMPDHPDITDAQIKDIVAYIVRESKNVPADKPPFPKPIGRIPAYLPLSLQNNYWFVAGYLSMVLLLVLALYLGVKAKEIERGKQ
jgi:mono/diheme cytochrome c family protein